MISEEKKCIYYSDYGAVGDGITNDFAAIKLTHEAANTKKLPVSADKDAKYFIGGDDLEVLIKTDTNWANAQFIIDDRSVKNPNRQIFKVVSNVEEKVITSINKIDKFQEKLPLEFDFDSFVVVKDSTTIRHIREGVNADEGFFQTDLFLMDREGVVDKKTPIVWDFENITEMLIFPVEKDVLTIKGGVFTTIANDAAGEELVYYKRGIGICRSNVEVVGITHYVTDELDNGAPYGGFLCISNCANVLVRNCKFSAHKVVKAGSYDLLVTCALNITYENCQQLNDISDVNLWGIFGSNYTKNLVFDQVYFSRFDAHKGTLNGVIRNSVIGYMGVLLIGWGHFLIENSKIYSSSLVCLRPDYGSTWEGKITIKNCDFYPQLRRCEINKDPVLIDGYYSGNHNFGYVCFMPEVIEIDGLVIHDEFLPEEFRGLRLFANFNEEFTADHYRPKYPYHITKEVVIKDLVIASGKSLTISKNEQMFKNVQISR